MHRLTYITDDDLDTINDLLESWLSRYPERQDAELDEFGQLPTPLRLAEIWIAETETAFLPQEIADMIFEIQDSWKNV